MAFKKVNERQWPLFVCAELAADSGDFAAASLVTAVVDLPPNAVVTGGGVLVDTAFNSTTNGLDVGDADDPDRYTSAVVDLKTVGYTALDGEFLRYPAGKTLTFDYTTTGTAPTTGKAYVLIEYVIVGRATENQP